MDTTLEIPQHQWMSYFNSLTERHQGWALHIEVMRMDIGDQHTGDGLALEGFSFETKGSAAGDVLIEAGDMGNELMIHHVLKPQRVRATDTQPGAEVGIQFESDDGTTTLVVLRRRPELPGATEPVKGRREGPADRRASRAAPSRHARSGGSNDGRS